MIDVRRSRVNTTLSHPAAANLETWSHYSWTDGLQVEALPALECLTVRTKNSVYEISVITPYTGEILIRGGRFFPTYTPAVLAGASLGGSFLKRHGIYVGFLMELQYDGQTLVTTRVQSVTRAESGRVQ
jgi:hypothetical protein